MNKYGRLTPEEKKARALKRVKSKRNLKLLELWNDNPEWTLQKTGERFNVTRERIRQILVKLENAGFKVRSKTERTPYMHEKLRAAVTDEIHYMLWNHYGTNTYFEWRDKLIVTYKLVQKAHFRKILLNAWKQGALDPLDNQQLKSFLTPRHFEILKLKKQGHTLAFMQKQFNLSKVGICRYIRNLKIAGFLNDVHPNQVKATSLTQEEIDNKLNKIRKLMRQGFTLSQISRQFGHPTSSMLQHYISRHYLRPKKANEFKDALEGGFKYE